jgi:hypothetical protein
MLKLIVNNGVELDIYEDLTMSLTYSILDITDISKRSTSFSKEFDIPTSYNNNNFFENIFKLDKTTLKFNRKKKVNAIVTDGGNVIFEGIIQLVSVTRSNKDIFYTVRLIGTLRNLIKETESINLQQLDLSEYNHTRDKETITDSWDFLIKKNGVDFVGREGYVYPYTIHNEESDLEDTTYIYNLFPATYVKTVWDKLFEFANFTYKSNFLNSAYFKSLVLPYTKDKIEIEEGEKYNRGVIRGFQDLDGFADNYSSMTNRQERSFSTWYYNTQLALPYNLSNINISLLNDPNALVLDNGNDLQFRDPSNHIFQDIYTCQNEGQYKIDINLMMFPRWGTNALVTSIKFNNDGVAYYRWRIELIRTNGQVEILNQNTTTTTTNPWHVSEFQPSTDSTIPSSDLPFNDISTDLRINFTGTRFMNPGDKIRIMLGFRHGSTKWDVVGGSQSNVTCQLYLARNIGQEFSKFSVLPEDGSTYGNESIILQKTLPDMNGSEFLMEIIKMFNLVIEQDKNDLNNYIIEPYDDYFSGGKIIDSWEYDRNAQMKIKLTNNIYSYKFTYDNDGDWINKLYKEDTVVKTYGEWEQFTNDEFADRKETLKLKFASSPSSTFRTNDRVATYYADIKDNVLKGIKAKPRILFYNGPRDCANYIMKDNQFDPSGTTLNKYAYAGMWDDPINPNSSLEFNYSDYVYYDSGLGLTSDEQRKLPKDNLWARFHQNSIRNKISDDYKIVEAYFYLTPKDIADFTFKNIIRIDNQHYRVLEISDYQYSNVKSLTKVILELITNFSFYEALNIVNNTSCPPDIKVTRRKTGIILTSESGAPISEQCCLEKGGALVNGTCVIRPFVIGTVLPGTVKPSNPIGWTPADPIKPVLDKVDPIKVPNIKIIDGGRDTVFPYKKTNQYSILDGTRDSVKNLGGLYILPLKIDGDDGTREY